MKHAVVSLIFAVVLLGILVALTLSIVNSDKSAEPAIAIPETLAGMRLGRSIRGDEAVRQISRLHQGLIELTDGVVAQYGGNDQEGTLWVGLTRSPEDAQKLIQRMTERITNGASKVFSNLQQVDVGSLRAYSVSGMGQVHYYYAHGRRTVWIALDPSIAQQGFEAAVNSL